MQPEVTLDLRRSFFGINIQQHYYSQGDFMTVLARFLITATVLGGLVAMPAFAAPTAAPAVNVAQATTVAPKAKTAQQERMTTCNLDAKGKTGDERKTFMSSCLKGEKAAPAKPLTASQQRMKTCNADAAAKSLKGDARKTFMSTCLKAG